MVIVTVQYMWIDDTSADVIKVDFDALYHDSSPSSGRSPISLFLSHVLFCLGFDHVGQPAGDQLLGLFHDARHQVADRRNVIDQAHCGADRRPAPARPPGHAGIGELRRQTHRGAIRIAPSSRITSPLSIGFSTMCTASAPYSSGLPSRDGCGT